MANKTLKVALTGGIASGKTLVSDLLEIHGCHIVDLDVIAREVVLPVWRIHFINRWNS